MLKRALSLLILCSLLSLVAVGPIMAGNDDYSITEYWTQVAPTFDGEWTSDDEWTDGQHVQISDNANFTYTADIMLTASMGSQFLIEIFDDDTDDPEDYWQICVDPSNGGGNAPGVGYGRIDIIGHTDVVCYEGDGTVWTEIPLESDIIWANAISDSPNEPTPHWILELQFTKTEGAIQLAEPPNGLRIAVYDESSEDGELAWPPDSDVDDPDTWGMIPTYSMEPIPEGLNFTVMVFLSSMSLLVGSLYLRKRSKTR
jgi:hypothetical protein